MKWELLLDLAQWGSGQHLFLHVRSIPSILEKSNKGTVFFAGRCRCANLGRCQTDLLECVGDTEALVRNVQPGRTLLATKKGERRMLFTIVVVVITYLSLVVGELVPKRIALNNPERIAMSMVTPMRVLSAIASPFIHLLSISTEGILRLIGLRPSGEPPITEEEINVLIEEGTHIGTFEAAEQAMIERIFRLADRRVSAMMTHRPDIIWLDAEASPQDISQRIRESTYSRFPVCQGSLDNVLGMVHVKDLLLHCLAGQSLDLKAAIQEPLYVIESTSTLKVLELFKQTGQQAALVIQEYGDIEGLIT